MYKFRNFIHYFIPISFLGVGCFTMYRSLVIPNSYQWIAFSLAWFTIGIWGYLRKRQAIMGWELFLFYIATISLPIAQIQTLEIFGEASLSWVNYTEHFVIAFVFTFILSPFLKDYLVGVARSRRVLASVIAVLAICVGYEALDFIFRSLTGNIMEIGVGAYWRDSIIDLCVGTLGAIAGAYMLEFVVPELPRRSPQHAR